MLSVIIRQIHPDLRLGALGYAGNIALRYTEMCYENPKQFPVLPKAVFAMNCPVDLTGLVHWCENEIKKNYFPGNVADGKYILDALAEKIRKLCGTS